MYPGAFSETTPEHPAIVMAGSGETVTYAQLDAEANRISQLFRSLGLQPGDHVAFCLENHVRLLPLAWGAIYAGLYFTALSSRLTTDELAYILDDCGARVFVTSTYKREQAGELVTQVAARPRRRLEARYMIDGRVDGYESYEDAIAAQPATPLDEERTEGRDMLYSSGTTGRPKGVKAPLTGAPLGTPDALHPLVAFLFQGNEQSVYLSPAPLYHAAPLRYSLTFQRLGATVVVMERFDPAEALALIERHRVTHSQWVPTMFIRMLKLPDDVRHAHDLSSLRYAVHAAAPCPVPVKQQMIEWWGPVLHEYYAGTEGNGFVYCNSEDWLAHPGTVGKSIVGELHILDENGDAVPQGQTGTVYFGGGADFEYHNDPDKTAAARDPQGRGWTTLGDVGYLDTESYLYLTDRKAYMIITGGVNVYPQETENLLAMHPKVADVAVLGVPNDDFGEEVKAVVEPVSWDDAGPALEAELIAHCREHLADVKCPRTVDFRPELPRHPTGKLYKRLLKDEYWKGHETRI
jgi:acyl-CoA synthetase (AMP-forming)/AMP-acid ligase II